MKLLSICIPTYNHANYLAKMLERLISLPALNTNEIEIVISDNASTDETQSVGELYARRYPQWIRYFRNVENVYDENFSMALSRGSGAFLKLANDTLLFSEEGVRTMLDAVRQTSSEMPILFFSNGEGTLRGSAVCHSFDDLWTEISFHSTWIGSFGIWKKDFEALPDFARARRLQLIQVDVLCRMMSMKKNAIIHAVRFAESMPRDTIGGYNLARVFGHNYFSILKEYVRSGEFSRKAYGRERFRMLRYHILPFYLSWSLKLRFPKTGYFRYLVRDCWSMPFFWMTLPFVEVASFCFRFKSL